MEKRALVDMEGNGGANTREKSCEKPPGGHRQGGGLDEETTNTREGRWRNTYISASGEVGSRKKQCGTNTTHKT